MEYQYNNSIQYNTIQYTHTHTHTQHVVGPAFHLSQYQATEGGNLVVYLSATNLTKISCFNGNIEVDIAAEDLPGSNALFGKCHPLVVYLLYLCVPS